MATARLTLQENSGESVDLWFAQEANRRNKNNVDATGIPYEPPGSTILVNLEQEESIQLSGTLPFRHLTDLAGYSSQKLTAGAEWVQKVFSFIGAMGDGLSVTDNVYGKTQSCFVSNFSWTVQPPEVNSITWTMELTVGTGIGPYQNRSPISVSPSTTATLAGTELPNPTRVKETVNVEVETTATPFPESAEDNLLSENSIEHTIEYEGKVIPAVKNNFDSDMRSLLGTNQIYTYASAWPGSDYDVMVEDYDTDDATESLREYTLKMIRGRK